MTVRRLKRFPEERPIPPATPRCDHTVQVESAHAMKWRRDRYGENFARCTRDSVVEIDGRNLCRLHAGHVVLDMYLSGELAPSGIKQ